MIEMKKLVIVGLAAVILSACSVSAKTDKAKVKLPGEVTVEVGDDDKSEGKFCPPGQAKKGRC